MFVHMVSFHWKPGTTPDDVAAMAAALASLPAAIPSIVSFAYGADFGVRDGNGDYGVMAIIDASDPAAYLNHPAHVAVATESIFPNVASKHSIQFPVTRDTLFSRPTFSATNHDHFPATPQETNGSAPGLSSRMPSERIGA